MSELTDAFEALAGRGAPGDATATVLAAFTRLDATRGAPPRRRTSLMLVAAALVVVVGTVAAAVGYVHDKAARIRRVDVGSLAAPDATPDVMTVLAVGVERYTGPDTRPAKRLDAVMLLRLNRVTGATAALSLPRDLADDDGNRLSASPSISPGHVVDEVERITNVAVEHYVEFDYAAFTKLVDVIGGVRMAVAQPIRDRLSGLDLAAGCVTLDGQTALAFVRARHLETHEADGRWTVDPTGDLGRVQRQQQLLNAAVTQWRRHTRDPRAIDDALDAVTDAVRLDDDFSVAELLRFARDWQRHDGTLRLLTLPTDIATLPNGAVVLHPRDADVPAALAEFTRDDVAAQPTTPAAACG
jgi:LCP family protein required for cell wall assembly